MTTESDDPSLEEGKPKKLESCLHEYYKSISHLPMLSLEEEIEVANRWQETGEKKYLHKLVNSNLRFVIKIASEYRHYGFFLNDLIQEGNIGLIKAALKYDPSKGFRLISYASWWIRAFIQEYILRNWSMVKIGTTQLQRRLFISLQSAQKRAELLVASADLETRREILALAVDGTVKDVEEMETRVYCQIKSLDAPFSSESDSNYYSLCRSDEKDGATLFEESEQEINHKWAVIMALEALDGREREIIMARYLFDPPFTLRELGEKLGISFERVRQIETEAESKMQRLLKPYAEDLLDLPTKTAIPKPWARVLGSGLSSTALESITLRMREHFRGRSFWFWEVYELFGSYEYTKLILEEMLRAKILNGYGKYRYQFKF